jgi:hypothetical protein
MIAVSFSLDYRLFGVSLLALFLAGILYNLLVAWLGHRKNGYTSLLVVGGVLFTLTGVALVSWQAAGLCLLAFAASGLPMVLGDIYRSIKHQEQALELMRQAAKERQS